MQIRVNFIQIIANFKHCRLNKIGKNPHIVSNRETLDSDCKTMNAIVNALSGGGSDVGSLESLPQTRIQSFHPR